MQTVIWLTLAFAVLGFFEVLQLLRNRFWRDLVVFGFLLILGFVLCLFVTFEISMPNPVTITRLITAPILEFLGIHVHYR